MDQSPLIFPETPPQPLDLLSEKAQEFSPGDEVLLRGDSIISRKWTVTKVGDRMLTIETDNMENLRPGDNTQVVTADEILRYDPALFNGPNPTSNPMLGGYASNPFDTPLITPPNSMYGGPVPTINFAPQFKIMNGGNDFSTEPTQQQPQDLNSSTIVQTGGNNDSAPLLISKMNDGGAGEPAPKEEAMSGPLDFSKMLFNKIQKLG